MRPKILLVILIIAALCIAPGAILRWRIAKSVAARVPGMLGPAQSYSVDVTGGLFGLIGGRIETVDILGRDVKLSNGVVVDRLDVTLDGVHFRPDQTVTKVEHTGFTASLSEDNLDSFLRSSRRDMRDAEVTLQDGRLSLLARPRVFALKTPVRVEGTLQIAQGCKLNLVISRLTARGIRVPGFVRGRIMHEINPVLDTSQMGVDAKLRSVQVSNGNIELRGSADVSKALAAR